MTLRATDPDALFPTVGVSDPRFEHGHLRHVVVKSPALGRRADVVVHATPAARAAFDVPVVILLHGVYSGSHAWTLNGGVHLTCERMQAAGELAPVVLAMPSDGLWGDGSGYLATPSRDAARWVVDEVPVAVRAAVPAVTSASPLCIGGLSMGGFGALRLAAAHPGRFRAASGHSSITEFDQLARFVEEPLEAFGAPPGDRSVLEAILRAKGALPALRFDCGVADPLLEENRALHAALVEAAVPHVYEEFAGGHDWAYWERHVFETLRFFNRVLSGR